MRDDKDKRLLPDEELELNGGSDKLEFSRRGFLQAAGGGIVVYFTIGDSLSLAQERGFRQAQYPTDFNAYVRIGEDGRVTCMVGKIEMGQGIITGLAQMCAEELDVPMESVDMLMGA